MNTFNLYICRFLLRKLLLRNCPAQIPRSGDKGRKINCFVISVDKQGKPHLLVDAINDDTLNCREWDGKSYSILKSVDLSDLKASDLFISHYYGLSEIRYSGVSDLVVGRTLLVPYIKIHLINTLEKIDQYFFNKKKFITKQRIDLLRFLLMKHLDDQKEFEAFQLMTDLYTIKWVSHPGGDSQLSKVQFFLDALVDTGELHKNQYKYSLTGNALKAIEEYEEQERRHTDNVKLQRRAFWLAVVLALLTAAQANLFKLPTLLDLSSARIVGSDP